MMRGIFTSLIKFITHLFHKSDNAFPATFDPQVNITRMSHKRIRVKSCIGSPFQDSRFTPLRSKQFRILRSFRIQKFIMRPDPDLPHR